MGGYAFSLSVKLVAPSIVHTAHTERLRSGEGSEHVVKSSQRNRAFQLTDPETTRLSSHPQQADQEAPTGCSRVAVKREPTSGLQPLT